MSARLVTVNFRGADLFGFETEHGTYVALKPIVEATGLDWSAQFRRTKRDPILSEGIAMMATPFAKGGDQEAVCLRLDLVNGWLFGIDAARIRDEAVRVAVLVYQRECYGVLARHFARTARPEPTAIPGDERPHEPEGARLRLVAEARHIFGLKAAGELWFALGLPVTPSMTERRGQLELLDYSRIRTAGDDAA